MVATDDRETWIPEQAESGIPDHAPESAKAIALGFDRLTGGDGAWLTRRDELELERTELMHTLDAVLWETRFSIGSPERRARVGAIRAQIAELGLTLGD